MLEAALVAWLISLLGDRSLRAVMRTVLGSSEQRALSAAMVVAERSVMPDLPESSRCALRAALSEQFNQAPAMTLDGRTRVRTGLTRAIQAQIAPLADSALTPSGKSYFEEIGVDPAQVRDDLANVVIRSIEQVGPLFPALTPLVTQLNADAIIEKVESILEKMEDPHRPNHPAAVEVAPVPGHAVPHWRSQNSHPVDPLERLIRTLLLVPAVFDDGSRREIINLLPSQLRDALPRSPVPRVQVLTMVSTCQNYAGGLRSLIRAIRLVEGDSLAMEKVDNLILELGGTDDDGLSNTSGAAGSGG
jgi:hypothetical protein